LNNPKTLNEKILYLSLCTDTSLWTLCADKYQVREYVTRCGFGDILVKLYGVWDRSDDIDFETLPEKFVMKGTHGCDNIVIVQNKHALDQNSVRAFFEKDLNSAYGAVEAGLHYMRIKPRVIAEEFLVNDEESLKYSSTLIDYKVWCFNGKPHYIWTVTNREGNHKETMLYDVDWKAYPEYQVYENGYVKAELMSAPRTLSKMLEAAEKLSSAFPVVRVDFYSLSDKLYFGELTFTSHGGLMVNFTDDFQKKAGDLIDLSSLKCNYKND
jgi:hypothetical protein